MKFAYASGTCPLEGFTIKRGVGSGGFGEVYFATTDAGKEVALKRVHHNSDVEMRGATQCLNFKHPNLVALFDIKYDDDDAGWIVMEFVSGESLRDVLDRYPEGMPHEEIRRWFTAIAEAVGYLHQHGIVHRDLKPGNVFDDGGIVKVGDYGLSKFISGSRRHDQTESVGTFHYMAPEIGKGVYGKEVDIYALGVILYEMLTGRVPFEGESSQEIIMKHLTDLPEVSGLPDGYREVVAQALNKDPNERFTEAEEMHRGLGSVLKWDNHAKLPPVLPKPHRHHLGTVVINDESAPQPEVLQATVVEHGVVTGDARGSSPEPIAQAVRAGGSRFRDWWHSTHSVVQLSVLAVAVLLLVLQTRWLLLSGVLLGMVYLIYFVIRNTVSALSGTRSGGQGSATTRPVTSQNPQRRRRQSRVPWQQVARTDLRDKGFAERFTELSGALLLSSIVVGVLSLVMLIAAGQPIDGSIDMFARFTWLATVSMAGSWVVLMSCKFWEGDAGEPLSRRFVLLGVGLLWGFAGYFGGDFLSVTLDPTVGDQLSSDPMLRNVYPTSLFEENGGPSLASYLVYFGGLLSIIRWWKQADPLRATRFSLFTTGGTAVGALFLPLPLPWGLMIAVTTSAAVQLSAPWISGPQRLELKRKAMQV
ncbi:MAG: serine/threonine protein kinase [Planctomycetaceae bacterium]|nr:serine/threonine protein kinase [Planctomycetaceae bacterium]